MPYCANCGAQVEPTAMFCHNCGRPLAAQGTATPAGEPRPLEAAWGTPPPEMRTIISIDRIVLMTVISAGLYLFYWFYLTWKHYRDYSGAEAFPVWHALTLGVPVYGLFRTHAHVRTFKELAANAGVETSLSPGWVVAGVAVLSALQWVPSVAGWVGFAPSPIPKLFLSLLSIAIATWVMVHVQANLNTFWRSLRSIRALPVKTGFGEVLLGVIGVLSWIFAAVGIMGAA
ncbi:MAG: zinc ribbon domain-containing protein [Chloroflexi bacterium]|nr:zinc ribbon domain-containing protein [Chloroflexota bacterium]